MPLTREQVYNELNGNEVKEILRLRFEQLLNSVPFLQRHITIPRVRMTLSVTLDMYADQPTPESHCISDDFTARMSVAPASHPGLPHAARLGEDNAQAPLTLESIVDASPLGLPPDQIRDDHGLPTSVPHRSKLVPFLQDVQEPAPAPSLPGIKVERDARGTTITQDFGPAITGHRIDPGSLKNTGRRSGSVTPPTGQKDE